MTEAGLLAVQCFIPSPTAVVWGGRALEQFSQLQLSRSLLKGVTLPEKTKVMRKKVEFRVFNADLGWLRIHLQYAFLCLGLL